MAYNKRGFAYYRMYNWNKCVEDNTKAIQLDPKLYQAYRDRSDSYDCLGLEKEAKEDKRMYEYLLREKFMREGMPTKK